MSEAWDGSPVRRTDEELTAAGAANSLGKDTHVTDGDVTGDEFGPDGDGAAGGGGGDACRNCGQEGHFARDCPEPRKNSGGCFNCGKEGHSKVDCTEPRVFKGTCRGCGVEGHRLADCPDRPPEVCRNCKQQGHKVTECTANRARDSDHVPTKPPDEAWNDLKLASDERDLNDFRTAVEVYVKATPDVTYQQLECAFRNQDFSVYLIAYEKEVAETFTLMNLQGKLGCKYNVGYFLGPKAPRGRLREAWPKSPEENFVRLLDAGVPVEKGIPKCSNCGEMGHTARACGQERVESGNKVEVRCVVCDETGHRARDCVQARVDRFACKNCGKGGHISKECTEPRSAANVECKQCSEMGHFAKDCPTREKRLCNNCGEEGHKRSECENPRNPAMMKCRNCDEMGHSSRECTKPRDYSRVQCQNCGEMGHTKVRCKAPRKEDGEEEEGEEAKSEGFTTGTDDVVQSEPAADPFTDDAPPAHDGDGDEGW